MNSIIIFFSKLTLEKKFLLFVITPILTVLLNIQLMLLGLAIIILIDLVTGVNKSLYEKKMRFTPWKRDFWLCVRSKGMRETWRKTYEYGIGVCVFVILESLVLKTGPIELMGLHFTLTELAVATASVIEVYSVFENLEAVTGRNLLKRLLKMAPKMEGRAEELVK